MVEHAPEEGGVVSSILTFGTISDENVKATMQNKLTVSYEQFQQLDFRIGSIIAAEKLQNSNKLLRLSVDFGDEKRTILAGIAKNYPDPKELIDQQALFLVNLEPKEIAGVVSQGMLLATAVDDLPVIISPTKKVATGSLVK